MNILAVIKHIVDREEKKKISMLEFSYLLYSQPRSQCAIYQNTPKHINTSKQINTSKPDTIHG